MRLKFSTFTALVLSCAITPILGAWVNKNDAGHWAADSRDCNPSAVVAQSVGVGREKGSSICATRWRDGHLPVHIFAKADMNSLRFLKIRYDDGIEDKFGIDVDENRYTGALHWSPFTDKWESLEISGGGWDGMVGKIKAQIHRPEEGDYSEMDAGKWHAPEGVKAKIGVSGRGVLLGFRVRWGDAIDRLEPIFSRTHIQETVLVDPSFEPSWETLASTPYNDRIDIAAVRINHTRDNLETRSGGRMYIQADARETSSLEVSTRNGIRAMQGNETHVGGKVAWKGDIWFLKNLTTEGSIEPKHVFLKQDVTYDLTGTKNGEKREGTIKIRDQHDIPGRVKTKCTSTYLTSKVNLKFKAKQKWIFGDNVEHAFDTEGEFRHATYSESWTKCKDLEDLDPEGDGKKVGVGAPPKPDDGSAGEEMRRRRRTRRDEGGMHLLSDDSVFVPFKPGDDGYEDADKVSKEDKEEPTGTETAVKQTETKVQESGASASKTALEPTKPEPTVPEPTLPETKETDVAVPDPAVPETKETDVAVPDPAVPETKETDVAVPDPAVPETKETDVAVPDPAVPEAKETEAAALGPAVPDPAVPDPAVPEAKEPEVKEPGVKEEKPKTIEEQLLMPGALGTLVEVFGKNEKRGLKFRA